MTPINSCHSKKATSPESIFGLGKPGKRQGDHWKQNLPIAAQGSAPVQYTLLHLSYLGNAKVFTMCLCKYTCVCLDTVCTKKLALPCRMPLSILLPLPQKEFILVFAYGIAKGITWAPPNQHHSRSLAS